MANGKRIAGRQGTKPFTPLVDEPTPRESTTPPHRVVRTPRAARTPDGAPPELQRAISAAEAHRERLMMKPNVIDVRAGYKFVGGRITDTPAVVVVVTRKVKGLPSANRIDPSVDGIATDVAPADPIERLRASSGREAAILANVPPLLIDQIQSAEAESALEAVPQITYEPPVNGDLSPVTEAMSITCHVSPDAGWRVLKPFLDATERQLVLGMYDFTAPHIYQTARGVLKNEDVTWTQTLGPKESLPGENDVDSTKAEDFTEGKVVRGLKRISTTRFQSAFAHVGSGQTFASAYHIKVAVRDGKAIWLSSGNWQSSNQPDIDFFADDADRTQLPRFNREWHAVVESPALAKRFRVFLEHDFRVANVAAEEVVPMAGPDLLIPVEEFLAEERAALDLEVFLPRTFKFTSDAPLTIQPILTPDNYVEVVTELLSKRPQHTLYFQNQSLNPVKAPTPEFEELMQLLIDYSNDEDLDVRLIFRNIGPVRKKLESLKAAGFNMSRVRMQAGCHTKGIIIDSRTVLIGSHNFTNQGIQVNRDASLLIRNVDIAKYYERVFLHDWDRLAKESIREEATTIPVGTDGAETAHIDTGLDYVRVPWDFLGED
jgi:hypothetical protein